MGLIHTHTQIHIHIHTHIHIHIHIHIKGAAMACVPDLPTQNFLYGRREVNLYTGLTKPPSNPTNTSWDRYCGVCVCVCVCVCMCVCVCVCVCIKV
jgi:hypothetical protein